MNQIRLWAIIYGPISLKIGKAIEYSRKADADKLSSKNSSDALSDKFQVKPHKSRGNLSVQ